MRLNFIKNIYELFKIPRILEIELIKLYVEDYRDQTSRRIQINHKGSLYTFDMNCLPVHLGAYGPTSTYRATSPSGNDINVLFSSRELEASGFVPKFRAVNC